jgi:hypothetical protein
VDQFGGLISGHGAVSSERLGTTGGEYLVTFDRDISACALIATPRGARAISAAPGEETASVVVTTWSSLPAQGPQASDSAFYVSVFCDGDPPPDGPDLKAELHGQFTRIKNIGNEAAGSFSVSLRWPEAAAGGTVRIDGLDAGAVHDIQHICFNSSQRVEVDVDFEVAERDETNNITTGRIC